MSEQQALRFVLSLLFNTPTLLFSVAYVVMTLVSYRRRGGTRALRAFLVAFALLSSVVAYMTVALGLIVVDAPVLPREARTIIFACRVVIFGVVVICCRVWWRNER